jgi:ribonuclease E
VLESTMKPCPHCGGTGHVRSDSSVALHVVRAIEEFLLKDSRYHITVKTPTATALYVLNHKRSTLVEMERRFGVTIAMEADETLGAQPYLIVRGAVAEKVAGAQDAHPVPPAPSEAEDEAETGFVEDAEEVAEGDAQADHDGQDEHPHRKRRRRRRRRGGGWEREGQHDETGAEAAAAAAHSATEAADEDEATDRAERHGQQAEGGHKKRRRGKRGGRRNRPNEDGEGMNGETLASEGDAEVEPAQGGIETVAVTADADETAEEAASHAEPEAAAAGESEARSETGGAVPEAAAAEAHRNEAAADADHANDDGGRLHRTRRRQEAEMSEHVEPVVVSSEGPVDESRPKKAGWWQRKSFF